MRAICLCNSLSDRLDHLHGTTLKFHSAFDSAANFVADDEHLVTFLSADRSLAVSSMNLLTETLRDYFDRDEAIVVDAVRHTLTGRTLTIQYGDAWHLSPHIRDRSALAPGFDLSSLLREALIDHVPGQGIYQDLAGIPVLGLPSSCCAKPKYAARLERFIDCLLRGGSAEAVSDAVKDIIGYGIGLTPAADDFVLGVLAVLTAADAEHLPHLAAACREELNRTTDISAEMLFHGSEGRFSQSVVGIFNRQTTGRAINDLLNYGHSSGHDTLCGIYTGLTVLRERRGATE